MIAIDLSKQHTLDDDPKAMQQINFTGNLARDKNTYTAMFFIIENWKSAETIFHEELWEYRKFCYFALIWYPYQITQYNKFEIV